ncbi:arginine ABC transporter substrate-binding protein [Legionella beliardensis]|uniref:Arginine ABC transporter substrate-binding protein n=1 Tax=Legionella beliardensis TaxID=91822 RepID=A0A378ID08_9GAMM|nr:transporter substrate-binding domain-containing protein [Legionella beliardensis]STX30184.1 arginine ABC transporter substrate-binding protein [Legionella beliardensis]
MITIFLRLLFVNLLSLNLYAQNLIIGASYFNPPMEAQATKDGVFTGFEIDLLNEVCRRIKANCIYKGMTFKEIMDAVLLGKINLGIDGFFITKERLNSYLFSLPYLQTQAQLFTATDSNINNTNINTGKKIGIEAGTVFKSILMSMYDNISIIEYANQQDMLQDLVDHKLDLIMFDFIGASYWVNNSQGKFKFVGNAIAFGLGYGIMANLNEEVLISQINDALQAMENDGTYLAIYSRYF